MIINRLALIVATLALTACGQVAPLRPALGEPLPAKPVLASNTPDAEQLLEPPPQARPKRVDELIRRSVPRKLDRFDLPPPDGGAAPSLEESVPSSSEQAGPANPR